MWQLSETILEVDRLTKKFGTLTAVKELSFKIQKGNIYGILGPNGSGKSTTLGLILNVVNKTSGTFRWFGQEHSNHHILKRIGAIIERPNFYPYMTAVQNLKIVCRIKGVSPKKIDEKLKITGLYDRRNDSFRTYSLGMKQRLAIASALLNDPEILILDEPTNGLDPQGIHEIREIISRIAKKGATILLASHLLSEVEKLCSHVVIIRKGEKLYSGRVDEIVASKGFFELQADDEALLMKLLSSYRGIASVKKKNGKIIAILNAPIEASDFNAYAFKNGLVLSHLAKRKHSLETQFLQLTENKSN